MITLSENEERLLETFRLLTPASADHVIVWMNRLREFGIGEDLDWSDSWSDEDIADVQRASFALFEAQVKEEI